MDAFELGFRFEPPPQREEDGVRDFFAWLRQVDIVASGVSTPLDQFLAAIRDAAAPWLLSPPPSSPLSPPEDFLFGSPPPGLRVRADDLARYRSAAFRLFVTELRPRWWGRWYGCAPDTNMNAADECLLLASVDIPVLLNSPGTYLVSDVATVVIDEAMRPVLLHLRLLGESLIDPVMGGSQAQLPAALMSIDTINVLGPTLLSEGQQVLLCNTAANNVTVSLPVTTAFNGRTFVLKRTNAANVCTVQAGGGDTIEGGASEVLPAVAGSSITVLGDGVNRNWHIIARA